MTLSWGGYDATDLPALGRLAADCLAADGGLPLFAGDDLLGARMLGGHTRAVRDGRGDLVAAASLLLRDDGAVTTGMVAPAHRRQGIGGALLGWAVERAGDRALTVAAESLSAGAEALYARSGFVETFRELVLRHPLVDLPAVAAPVGVRLVPVAEADPGDLFAAYVGSFADRPGFPDPTRAQWLVELEGDSGWRRDLSVVAYDGGGVPVGFVNVLDCWIDQVGVVPSWRGRRLGAHLVARSLTGLAGRHRDAWLTVHVANAAAGLYARLGFAPAGSRGRFSRPPR